MTDPRVDRLFDEAMDQPPEARRRFVLDATGGDPAVRAELLAMLEAADRTGILDRPPGSLLAEVEDNFREQLQAALAGRYRIDRLLGQGGMASVFLAHEDKHARAVVLKVLRPEVAALFGPERFSAEIEIVARLGHPHIIPMLDSGEADGFLYYAMPWLGDETLFTRLRRGRLELPEALTVFRDVAAGLAHAHAHGIVHRDLKPENVLLTGGHAYLMDFGVARIRSALSGTRMTREGVAVGTPLYMAPEQAAGESDAPPVDVYAWGLLARESLLGSLSLTSDLGQRRPDVPLALVRLIAACLNDDPAARPQDARALVEALRTLETGDRVIPALGMRRRTVAVLVGLIAILSTALVVMSRRPRPIVLDELEGPVVVTPFRNETGDTALAVWGRLAGDWITQGLEESGQTPVVPWPVALEVADRVAAGGRTLQLPEFRRATGAGIVVTGSYYLLGDQVRFQMEVVDAVRGALLGSVPPVEVPRDSLLQGIAQIRNRLLGVLAVRGDPVLSMVPGLTSRPPTYAAYREFERGIALYNRMEYREAADALQDAWRLDTTFFPPLIYAARALWNVGARDQTDSLTRLLRARDARLPAQLRLQLGYTEALLDGDGARALAAIRAAARAAPGSRDVYNYGLAALQMNQPAEAEVALRSLDPDHGTIQGWAPYWYTLAHALHLQGKFAEEIDAARAARERHPDSRAAWVHEGRALASLGRLAALDSLVEAASGLPTDTYWSQGAMLVTAGEELEAHGRPDLARHYYDRAERWLANQLVREPSHRAHRYWMAALQYDRGTWTSVETYAGSLVRDFPDNTTYRTLWALAAAHRGDSSAARRRLGPPDALDRSGMLVVQARLAAALGDLAGAVEYWAQAAQVGIDGIVWLHGSARQDLVPLRDDPRFRRLGLLPDGG